MGDGSTIISRRSCHVTYPTAARHGTRSPTRRGNDTRHYSRRCKTMQHEASNANGTHRLYAANGGALGVELRRHGSFEVGIKRTPLEPQAAVANVVVIQKAHRHYIGLCSRVLLTVLYPTAPLV